MLFIPGSFTTDLSRTNLNPWACAELNLDNSFFLAKYSLNSSKIKELNELGKTPKDFFKNFKFTNK